MTGTEDGPDRVGPIVFSDRTARRQLLLEGVVVTFRPGEQRTTGETWWRKSRTGEKMGDVEVRAMRPTDPADPHDLAPYLHHSGFESLADWMEAIKELHGGEFPDLGWVYEVRAIEGECARCGERKPIPEGGLCAGCNADEAHELARSRGGRP